jgi:hypothetical protein
MASSPSSHKTCIPFATVLEWYKIRDSFFWAEFCFSSEHPFSLPLEMASSCDHPDARWLTEACAGKTVETKEDVKRVFSALGQNDARALCFAWMLGDQGNETALRRSADLGFAFAQALLAEQTQGEERFKFAQLAAAQGERDGLFWLGCCFRYGVGCKMDLDEAKESFLRASKLGHVSAMMRLGEILDASDPLRWRWWGRAAALGDRWSFMSDFARQVEVFNSGCGSAAVVFAIGQALYGHVIEEKGTIFNDGSKFDSRIGPAKKAIAVYEAQITATKDAMRAWTLVGIHFNVVKDVRKLIAKLIWDSREEALYNLSLKN